MEDFESIAEELADAIQQALLEASKDFESIAEELADAIQQALLEASKQGAVAALKALRAGCLEMVAEEAPDPTWETVARRVGVALEVVEEGPIPS